MAKISRAHLVMSRNGGTRATLTVDVEFSRVEVELNMEYMVDGILYERDDSIDRYILRPNGHRTVNVSRVAQGDKDDFIAHFNSVAVRPNGKNKASVNLVTKVKPDKEWYEEEYRAFAWVLPELTYGATWSNEVEIDLG